MRKLVQWRGLLASAAFAVIAICLCAHIMLGENGWVKYRQKKAEYQKLQQDLQRMDAENRRLDAEIKALKSDPKAIEKEAREQLHYARPGEVIYALPDPEKHTEQTPGLDIYKTFKGQEKAWKDAIASLHEGAMLFQHPPTMHVRKTEMTRVRISQNINEDLRAGLVSEGIGKPEELQVDTVMKVRLTGDSEFEVVPLSDEAQVLDKTGFNEWAFSVTPKENGQWPLHLVVMAVIKTPWGEEKTKDFPVKEEYVTVVITTPEQIKYFLQDYWQWVAGAVVFPFFALCWNLYSKRKESRADEQDARVKGSRIRTAEPETEEVKK